MHKIPNNQLSKDLNNLEVHARCFNLDLLSKNIFAHMYIYNVPQPQCIIKYILGIFYTEYLELVGERQKS